MFICSECKKSIGPSISPEKIITEKRDKIYTNRVKKDDMVKVWETTGWEIVEEKNYCPDCAKDQVPA